jgi:glycolate oxidase
MYGRVTAEIARELVAIAGESNVLFGSEEQLLSYSHDEIPGDKYRKMPEAVVKVSSTAETAAVMKLASRERIPVTPRGGGSGLSGGAVPLYGGIVISFEKMNRIIDLDLHNLTLTVEAGVITGEINQYLQGRGLFYPGYPMSKENCFIGGNVAENAGGGKAIKYGVTGRYVLGLKAVLPSGQIITLGGKRVKDVTGYSLIPLLVGSEGTLALFTEITLRLLPAPSHHMDFLFFFEHVENALSLAPALMAEGKLLPASIEFMDRASLELSAAYLGEQLPGGAGSLLLVQLEGSCLEQLMHEADILSDLAEKHGAIESLAATEAASQRKIWRLRETAPEAVKAKYPVQGNEDITVPPAAVASYLALLRKKVAAYGFDVFCYGHAGDGNIHARIIKPDTIDIDTWESTFPLLLRELYGEAAAVGGTISGEHGIGFKRNEYVSLVLGEAEISLMQDIKNLFDPLHILNPGKVFPSVSKP